MTRRTILLVDDDDGDVELTRIALGRNEGVEDIVIARSAAEALDYLLRSRTDDPAAAAHLPALVLLDLNMSPVGGLEVLRRIRADERTRMLPVVVLTTSLEERDVRRCYELGANSYVRKPVDFAAFHETARSLVAYWLRINQPPPGAAAVPDRMGT